MEPNKSTFRPWHLELMHRLLLGQTMDDIAKELKVHRAYLDTIANSPLFQAELERQRAVSLKAVAERLEGYSHEALDAVITTMRSATHENVRLQAALQILDRCGYVRVDKQMSIVADAEKIIKEMSKIPTEVTIVPTKSATTHDDNGGKDEGGKAEPVEHGKDGSDLHDRRGGHQEPSEEVPGPPMAGVDR